MVGFGVCRLAIVPVCEQPDYRSIQYNQLLFGEHYEVTGAKGSWLSIKLAFDDSGGWITQSQHHAITPEYYEQINASDYKITTDISSTLLYHKNTVHITMGSIVPISNSELFKAEEQLAFNGESKSLSQKRDPEFLNTILAKYGNAPYVPGGKSPFGIDATGLTQMAFKICGHKLPRTLDQQLKVGSSINSIDKANASDIIFLKKVSDGEISPAILQTPGKIMMVDGHAQTMKIDSKGIKLEGQKKYAWEIHEIRRVIGQSSDV
jgi:cell wall-associated NlpC family hydrolase